VGDYRLYTDKVTSFECKIQLEGAKLRNATARVVVESDDVSLLYEGKVDQNGQCLIPIGKLKGLLDEESKGMLGLEIIVDDTYFRPWEAPFVIVASKQLRVEVVEPKPKKSSSILVDVVNPQERAHRLLTKKIVSALREQNITSENILGSNKRRVTKFIKEMVDHSGYDMDVRTLLTNVVKELNN
jgi:hypothetical protein